MARYIPPQNLLDKAIAYVAPKMAVHRMMHRQALAISGGYTGARVDRPALRNFNPAEGSPNVDIVRDLKILRGRSRDLVRNSTVACGAVNTIGSHVIGTGLSASPSINIDILGLTADEAEEWNENTKSRYELWASSKDCHLQRMFNLYQLQGLAFRSMLESGDSFTLTPIVNVNGKNQLALQLLEGDHICNKDYAADTEDCIAGIKIDTATGAPISVMIAKNHPGDYRGGNAWEERAIRGAKTDRLNVIQLFEPLRPGQLRGVPIVAPIIEPIKQLARYTDAELSAAVLSGLFSIFTKMDPEAFGDIFDEDAKDTMINRANAWDGNIEGNKVVNLLPGESIEQVNPGRPNPQFDPFFQAIMRQIGMALELPVEVLMMHFQSSYSAARASMLMAWRMFRRRRDLMISTWCQPIYELWLDNEIAQGRISAPGYFADDLTKYAWRNAQWLGDGPGSIDPMKDVAAAERRIDIGISTKDAESIAYDGRPWREKNEQRAREIAKEKENGTYVQIGSIPTTSTATTAPEKE